MVRQWVTPNVYCTLEQVAPLSYVYIFNVYQESQVDFSPT